MNRNQKFIKGLRKIGTWPVWAGRKLVGSLCKHYEFSYEREWSLNKRADIGQNRCSWYGDSPMDCDHLDRNWAGLVADDNATELEQAYEPTEVVYNFKNVCNRASRVDIWMLIPKQNIPRDSPDTGTGASEYTGVNPAILDDALDQGDTTGGIGNSTPYQITTTGLKMTKMYKDKLEPHMHVQHIYGQTLDAEEHGRVTFKIPVTVIGRKFFYNLGPTADINTGYCHIKNRPIVLIRVQGTQSHNEGLVAATLDNTNLAPIPNSFYAVDFYRRSKMSWFIPMNTNATKDSYSGYVRRDGTSRNTSTVALDTAGLATAFTAEATMNA